jgi:cell division protein FtsL
MLTAEKWYQHQEKYVKYGIDMRPVAKKEEEILPERKITLTARDRLKLLVLVFLIGALCIAGVVTTAYATQIKYNINAIVRENAVIQGEIENLDVAIESANNIKIIEEKAVSQLGMVYPKFEQMVFIAEEPDKINDFALVLREQAYN